MEPACPSALEICSDCNDVKKRIYFFHHLNARESPWYQMVSMEPKPNFQNKDIDSSLLLSLRVKTFFYRQISQNFLIWFLLLIHDPLALHDGVSFPLILWHFFSLLTGTIMVICPLTQSVPRPGFQPVQPLVSVHGAALSNDGGTLLFLILWKEAGGGCGTLYPHILLSWSWRCW